MFWTKMKKDITKLQYQMDCYTTNYERRLEDLELTVKELNSTLTKLDTKINNISNHNIEEIQKRITNLQDEFNKFKEKTNKRFMPKNKPEVL